MNIDLEALSAYIAERLCREQTEGHGAYANLDSDGMSCEYDGHLDILEIVKWVLEKQEEGKDQNAA